MNIFVNFFFFFSIPHNNYINRAVRNLLRDDFVAVAEDIYEQIIHFA